MTQRALNADRGQFIAGEDAFDADDGVSLEQCKGCLWLVEIHGGAFDHFNRRFRHLSLVDFQPELESLFRTQSRPDASLLFPEDRAVQLKFVSPERFRTERVVSKDLLPLF